MGAEASSEIEVVVNDPLSVGPSLRRVRQDAHLSQRELGQRIGLSQPAVARLEAGSLAPTLATVQRIATALGHDVVLRLCAANGERGPAIPAINEASDV